MTTAARPTFDSAQGGQGRGEKDLSAITRQYSSRDLPAHTKLKYREPGQGTDDERRGKDYRRELEDREIVTRRDKEKGEKRILLPPQNNHHQQLKKLKLDHSNLDADDVGGGGGSGGDDSDSDSSDDDGGDDTAALLAELNRIKKERAAEAAKRESEKRAEEERIRAENILSGNPLLNYAAGAPGNNGPAATQATKNDMKVKRRWDEDVVFKNCARADDDGNKKGFINDCLRSEFHRKFMEKYIK